MSIFVMASDQEKKCRQYSVEYWKYGFVQAPQNQQQPMCLLCEKTFSNEAMKPSRLLDYFKKIRSDKKDKGLAYFNHFVIKCKNRKQLLACFLIVLNKLPMVYELLTTSLC